MANNLQKKSFLDYQAQIKYLKQKHQEKWKHKKNIAGYSYKLESAIFGKDRISSYLSSIFIHCSMIYSFFHFSILQL